MKAHYAEWLGLGLSFLATFLLSLFHISLGLFSKISLSRLLENKDREYRQRILDLYDEMKIAVEYFRTFFFIAFLVFLFLIFPRLQIWPLWFFLVLFALYIVFFDYVPRLLTSLSKDKVLCLFLPSFRLIHFLAVPILILSKKLVEKEEKEEEEADRETTDEEIDTFIDEAEEEGIIEGDESGLLRSVVEFGDTIVREIMTPRVNMVCIRKDAKIDNLKDLIIKDKYSRIPVYKDRMDNIEGIVIAKDLLEYADEKHRYQPIEALIRPVIFVPESMLVSELLKEFKKANLKLAIVADEHGGVSGLVTMEDLVEEIVGEIQDEYDTEETQIHENAPHDYTVSGAVEIEELEELFDQDLAEDDFITAGGLITHNLGRLPKKGEVFEIKGISFEILDVDQKKIKRLRIKKVKSQE